MSGKSVLIIGGGAAGLESAAQLISLGYKPVIVEKEESLGGNIKNWDRLFPDGIEAKAVLDGLLKRSSLSDIYLNSNVIEVNNSNNNFTVTLSNNNVIKADSILITTGFDVFKAERKEEYGYGIYDHVITNVDLEKFFQSKHDERINSPKKIGFVHCVGSRDEKICNRNCSKVCCVTAVKQAIELKEMFPDSQAYCFYMDLRMFNRGFEDIYLEAQSQHGVRFIRGRVSEVSEDIDKKVVVKCEDTLSSKPMKIKLDLLVLMSGMLNNSSSTQLSPVLGVKLAEDGFYKCEETIPGGNKTNVNGVFIAGTATGPKTLPETINDARSAAIEIHNYLNTSING